MIDTHAHLVSEYYDDLDEMLNNLKGLIVVNCGTNRHDIEEIINLCKKHTFLRGSLGIHPHFPADWNEETRDFIKNNINNPGIVAIGEIGLDYHYGVNQAEQKKIFREQLALASELEKPVIIHSREALEDTLEILKDFPNLPKVIHSFDYDWQAVPQFLSINCLISVNGILTFEKNNRLAEIVKKIDLQYLLLETDSPYLTPAPERGKRNDSTKLKYIIKKVAELRNAKTVEIEEQNRENAIKLFDLNLEK